jgi:hypothetical protein
MVRNVPCHRVNVMCNKTCGKLLPCGGHQCDRQCHNDPCIPPGGQCKQPCGKRRPDCGHPCRAPCHAPSICPITQLACKEPVTVSCACGRIQKTQPCRAKGQDNISNKLPCDEACAVAERNRRLAEALQIDTNAGSVFHTDVEFEDELVDYARANPSFIRKIEEELMEFIQSNKKQHYMQPMKAKLRRIVHMICEHYGLETAAVDPEPNRFLILSRTRDTHIPTPLLSQVASGQWQGHVRSVDASGSGIDPVGDKAPAPNALLIRHLKFGLTQDELEPSLKVLGDTFFSLDWMTDEDVLVRFTSNKELSEASISRYRSMLRRDLITAGLAGDVRTVTVDASGKIIAPVGLFANKTSSSPAHTANNTSTTSNTPVLSSNSFHVLSTHASRQRNTKPTSKPVDSAWDEQSKPAITVARPSNDLSPSDEQRGFVLVTNMSTPSTISNAVPGGHASTTSVDSVPEEWTDLLDDSETD